MKIISSCFMFTLKFTVYDSSTFCLFRSSYLSKRKYNAYIQFYQCLTGSINRHRIEVILSVTVFMFQWASIAKEEQMAISDGSHDPRCKFATNGRDHAMYDAPRYSKREKNWMPLKWANLENIRKLCTV